MENKQKLGQVLTRLDKWGGFSTEQPESSPTESQQATSEIKLALQEVLNADIQALLNLANETITDIKEAIQKANNNTLTITEIDDIIESPTSPLVKALSQLRQRLIGDKVLEPDQRSQLQEKAETLSNLQTTLLSIANCLDSK